MDRARPCHRDHDGAVFRFRIGRKLAVVGILFIVVLSLSFLEALSPLNRSLLNYLALIWWAVPIGLLVGGLIDYFVPDGFLIRYLGQSSTKSLLYAMVAGFLMTACSHGILAIAIQLYKKGASVPVVITFLLASPWANLPMTVLLFGFFGWKAVFIVFGAMSIALTTGFMFTVLSRLRWIEGSNPSAISEDISWERVTKFRLAQSLRGVASGASSLANMVLWWILIGVMVAAIVGAYVPEHLFVDYLGADFSGILLTLVFASVIEVCSEGTSPIAFEIYDKVGVLGNPFVFLMAGVATDYTEIGLIWSNIGRRAAIWLPIIAIPQIVIVALLFNRWIPL